MPSRPGGAEEGAVRLPPDRPSLDNLDSLYTVKAQRAEALDRSVGIAGDLFNAARANYLEVLTAQRDAIDARLELVETRLRQQVAATNLYRALGGGWR